MNKNSITEEFKNLFAGKSHEEIQTILRDMAKLMSYYRCALLEVETKFKVLSEQFSIKMDRNPIESVKTRLKSLESIREKLTRRGYDFSISAIESSLNDVAGIRVICSYIDDIYMLAKSFLSQDDVVLIEVKDYIKSPKPNGYRSLHLIIEIPIFLADEKKFVRAEVQLRTIAMESWANIEHQLRYKKEFDIKLREHMDREMSECAEMSHLLDIKMQKLRLLTESADDPDSIMTSDDIL